MAENKKKITTNAGCPIYHYEDSQTVGAHGPIVLQDYFLHEKLATFNRERIPERIVHAKGSGVYGKFTVTNDISAYCRAELFSKVGKETKVFVRFSTVGGEKGSADTERDPRGFAVKFYTEGGNWDLVGNNTPVFFIKDPRKFPDFIHTQKRDPKTNCKNATSTWDFYSLNPETLHQLLILMSDRGTPDGYRFMNGYGGHAFTMINEDNERIYVKFHFKSVQGIKTLTSQEATAIKGKDPDYAQRDLVNAIEKGHFPKYALKIQVMSLKQAKEFKWNPFDLTKVWPHKEYPLIDVGEMELNEIPGNYFEEVEQAAFSPSNIVDGIEFSPDKMLHGRIMAYPDAQRYRVGVNYESLPVNKCPFGYSNYHRDGAMRSDGNGQSSPNYFPNSFDEKFLDTKAKRTPYFIESNIVDHFDRNEKQDDHYTQTGQLFEKVMNPIEQENTVQNITDAMRQIHGEQKDKIIARQLHLFYACSMKLGKMISQELGVNFSPMTEDL